MSNVVIKEARLCSYANREPERPKTKRPQRESCGLYRLRSKVLLRRSLLGDVVQASCRLGGQWWRREKRRRIHKIKELRHIVRGGIARGERRQVKARLNQLED
jgi:hypothetical protein